MVKQRGLGKRIAYMGLAVALLNTGGCLAAATAFVVTGVAVSVTTFVNMARKQYPDVDFDKPAPVEVTYSGSYGQVWNAVIDSLFEMQEQTAVVDKNSGIIRTVANNLNDRSWIEKGIGLATFKYEYNIIVRSNEQGVTVRPTVPFKEEKMFLAEKQANIPEGSNMMRHIFFRSLNQKITEVAAKMPDRPDQDIRYAPMDNRDLTAAPVHQKSNSNSKKPESAGTVPAVESSAGLSPTPGKVRELSAKEVQQILARNGYAPGPADGVIGRRTNEALKQFQLDRGLHVTGQLDSQTIEALTMAQK